MSVFPPLFFFHIGGQYPVLTVNSEENKPNIHDLQNEIADWEHGDSFVSTVDSFNIFYYGHKIKTHGTNEQNLLANKRRKKLLIKHVAL